MISIIIPTLNEEKIIAKSIEALKSRLTIPHEIIVSDGKSLDKTTEIANRFADRVVIYSGAKRQTIAQGRNDGARVAKGDFLVFLDADCSIPNPDEFFTRAFTDFKKYNLTALTSWLMVLPEEATFVDNFIGFLDNSYQLILNNVLHIGAARGEFQMMTREAFDRVGGFNESLVASEDFEMFYRLSRIGKTRLDRNLIMYHTGRRAHHTGWPKLLSLWFLNSVWMIFFKKAYVKEWKEVR